MQQISGGHRKEGLCAKRGGERRGISTQLEQFSPYVLALSLLPFLKVAQWVGVSRTRLENGGSLLLYQHYPLLPSEGLASLTLGAGLALQSWALKPPKTGSRGPSISPKCQRKQLCPRHGRSCFLKAAQTSLPQHDGKTQRPNSL